MEHNEKSPEHLRNIVPRRWDERRDSGDARPALRREREYEEITAFLRALRAADFDLGNRDNADDERLLTQMYQEWRERYEKRQIHKQGRFSFFRWFGMFVAGASATLFGPDLHQWLKSYWPWHGN